MHHASRDDMGGGGERERHKQREPYSNWHHADSATVRKNTISETCQGVPSLFTTFQKQMDLLKKNPPKCVHRR